MSEDLQCYRCGASLEALSLPISRRDECPECSVYLHVCKMCRFYDPHVPKQCTEDDAEEVKEKERPNFCDWFKPDAGVFDPARAATESRARGELAALFGDEEGHEPGDDALLHKAEDLFK